MLVWKLQLDKSRRTTKVHIVNTNKSESMGYNGTRQFDTSVLMEFWNIGTREEVVLLKQWRATLILKWPQICQFLSRSHHHGRSKN